MSAEQSQRQTGSGRATVSIAVLIFQCSFSAVPCEYELLRLERGMVLMNLNDGEHCEVRKLGNPSESANFGKSRDMWAWRGQRDEPLSPPRFLRLQQINNGLSTLSVCCTISGILGKRAMSTLLVVQLYEGTVI